MTATGADEPIRTAVAEVLADVGIDGPMTDWRRLTGGASRETYRFTVGADEFVLQRERPGGQRRPEGMAAEADLVRAAGAQGVRAPEVVVTNADVDRATAIGPSFFVTRVIDGETIARRILRDDRFASARTALTTDLADALAGIHRIDPGGLAWLEVEDRFAVFRQQADELALARPAFELAFRWLEANRPAVPTPSLVHGDFRLGNLIVDDAGLAGVIDWELAHLGDPLEDLAWPCVRAWRFGAEAPVAGVGDIEPFLTAYEQASGRAVDRAAFHWWRVLGSLTWGIMCGRQAEAHLSGRYRSVELAAIGRRLTEQEHDVLSVIDEVETSGVLS